MIGRREGVDVPVVRFVVPGHSELQAKTTERLSRPLAGMIVINGMLALVEFGDLGPRFHSTS
jgi:hypothetical protein